MYYIQPKTDMPQTTAAGHAARSSGALPTWPPVDSSSTRVMSLKMSGLG